MGEIDFDETHLNPQVSLSDVLEAETHTFSTFIRLSTRYVC